MNEINSKSYTCPFCGFFTRTEENYGTFEICETCGWEDDFVQANNPNFEGGVNLPSLNQAIKNYKEYGAISEEKLKIKKK